MALMKIGSTNPKLSFVLSKNPQTIRSSGEPFTRTMRKGNVYGWFSKPDDSEFTLFFKDADNDSSFSDSDFEYLDQTRYVSPYAYMLMVNTCLASAMKNENELDTTEYKTQISLVMKISNWPAAQAIARHLKNVEVDFVPMAGNVYGVYLMGSGIQLTLNAAVALCLIQAISDKDQYVYINTDAFDAYIRVLNRIEAPYFVRYMFGKTLFQDANTFNKFKAKLELPGTTMNYGDTQRQRYSAIANELIGGECLIDIGCGEELFYTKRLAKKYDMVVAFDADQEIAENGATKMAARKMDNVVVMHQLVDADWVESSPEQTDQTYTKSDYLLTEVIEHMEYAEAKALVVALLKKPFNTMVITVPDKDFNANYLIEEDCMRHDDHKWELSARDFKVMMEECLLEEGVAIDSIRVTYRGVGDSVDGVFSGSMVIFERIEA